jgi:hypothetical protein
MAGSYKHAVTRSGNLRSNESFVDMIENLGDAYEMAEEMYGMIWYLANREHDVKAAVEGARQNYKRGLEIAREANRAS